MAIINHQLINEDFFIPNWEVNHLFLGTFNPEGGDHVQYFYGRPTNFFWRLLSDIFNENFDRNNIQELLAKLKKHKIACMDMIKWVDVEDPMIPEITGRGYSDAKIINNRVVREYNTSSINQVINSNPLLKVYSTCGVGSTLKEWRNEKAHINSNIIALVSPSPVARVPLGEEKYPYALNNWSNLIII